MDHLAIQCIIVCEFLLRPWHGSGFCNVFVGLSHEPHVRTSPNFLCMSSMVVSPSSYGDVVIVMYFRFCACRHISYSWAYNGVTVPQRCCARAKTPCCVVLVASHPIRRRAPRLDESFVQGVTARSMRYIIGLFTEAC